MQGIGSSGHMDLSKVVIDSSNIRKADAATGMNRPNDPEDGCAHTEDGVRCIGPADMKYQNNHYCIDHIDIWLCCGSKLSIEQRQIIMARPERSAWIEETANARMLAAAQEREEWEAHTFSIVGSDVEEDQVGFDWQTHQEQLAKQQPRRNP